MSDLLPLEQCTLIAVMECCDVAEWKLATNRCIAYANVVLRAWPDNSVDAFDITQIAITKLISGKRSWMIVQKKTHLDCLVENLTKFALSEIRNSYKMPKNRRSIHPSEYPEHEFQLSPEVTIEGRDMLEHVMLRLAAESGSKRLKKIFLALVDGVNFSNNQDLATETGLSIPIVKREKARLRQLVKQIYNEGSS